MTLEPTINQPRTLGTDEPKVLPSGRQAEPPSRAITHSEEQATVGRELTIKGEVAGSQSLKIDGRVEGEIKLPGCRVTIGANGVVHANIWAAQVVILGRVRGVVTASDRVDIRREGSLIGDVVAGRISIEEGAYFKGGIDIRVRPAQATSKPEQAVSIILAFDPKLSPDAVESTLKALADYYRACGGVGLEIESEIEPVTATEKVHA